MSEEVVDQTPVDQAAADAAEQAAYDEARGIEPSPEQEQQETPAEVTETPTAETPPEETVAVSPVQVRELMAQVALIPELQKQLRDTNGKYGALKQTIEGLQKPAVTPEGGAVDLDESLADLKAEFPELADLLKGSLTKVLSRPAQSMSQEDMDRMVADRLQAARETEDRQRREKALEALTNEHPNWVSDRQSPQFQAWLETMAPRTQARILRSEDPDYVAERLDDFVSWRDAQTTASASTENQQRSRSRLESAITPTKGSGQAQVAAVSEQEAYDQARAQNRRHRK